MLGLFGSLDMASQSLSVQQEASAVAGQNLANVNNTAYAREQVNVQSATPLQTPIGQEGTGVVAVSITEVRDALLDTQIQSEGSVSGSLTSQQNALEDAQAYLNEQLTSSSSTGAAASQSGLTADLSNLFAAFQTLSTNPSSIPDRQAVAQSAQQLSSQFNSVSAGLATVQSNLNASITSDVAASNQDLSDIASLNQQIWRVE
jgi:flagellar hook-associated protein 1 FlgK